MTNYWTNSSVLALSENQDPIEAILDRSRAIVWSAIDKGWRGPPFDPFELGKILGLRIQPRHDIADARTIPQPGGKLLIEFNPTRPRRRIRFSIAHEIAHTLFPDCADSIRNREKVPVEKGDSWQLEMLCNLSASELLMPAFSFEDSTGESDISIEHVLDLAKKFEVSTESVLLKLKQLTDKPLVSFAASPIDPTSVDGGYRIDYANSNRGGNLSSLVGRPIRSTSRVRECTAIGYTAKSEKEDWPSPIGEARMECVGVPPFPGSMLPRVVGFLSSLNERRETGLRMIRGNALDPRGSDMRMIVHVVNDKARSWGAGFGSAVQMKFPIVKERFGAWVRSQASDFTLGSVFHTQVNDRLFVAQMVAQKGYGPAGKARIRYEALRECLKAVCAIAKTNKCSIHMPRIGTGYGGGVWTFISEMIREELVEKGVDVTVYTQPNAQPHMAFEPSLFDH